MKEESTNVYFEDELEKSIKSEWQNEKCKYRYFMFTEKDHKNIAAW